MINYSKKQDLHNKLSKSSNKRPFLATTTHQCTTVCHYMVRYPFLHYSALFLWIFMNFTHTHCAFFMLLSFVLCLFMFALSSCCILFVMLSFHGALFLYHASYSLCFYHVLFSYCSFFFSCCGFHVTLFSFFHLSLLVDLFSCCTISIFHFFVLHFFHVAFLTVCIVTFTLF